MTTFNAIVKNHRIEFAAPQDLPDGTAVRVEVSMPVIRMGISESEWRDEPEATATQRRFSLLRLHRFFVAIEEHYRCTSCRVCTHRRLSLPATHRDDARPFQTDAAALHRQRAVHVAIRRSSDEAIAVR